MGDKNAIPRTPDPDAAPGLKLRLEERLGLLDTIVIETFRSFGTPEALHVRGRVVERKGLEGSADESRTWRNVIDMIHRLESDEVPGAQLRAHFKGRTWKTVSDAEGYFVFDLDVDEPLDPGWHDVHIELVASIGEPESRFVDESVLIPSADAAFAVVSDLDDTVIRTKNTEFFQQLAIVFGKGARERVPFPGIPAFYRGLQRGTDGPADNPIFYVSRSGWNLHHLFVEFMEFHDIPKGPLFLSDLRLIEEKSPVIGSDNHKFENIDLLIRTYPEQPFILIGDSGMEDPEIYAEIVKKHPGRVRAVYIHDVTSEKRDRAVDAIGRDLQEHGVPLVRAETTIGPAEHAAEEGLISAAALDEVRKAVEAERVHESAIPDSRQ